MLLILIAHSVEQPAFQGNRLASFKEFPGPDLSFRGRQKAKFCYRVPMARPIRIEYEGA